jgi:hypothetical protein
MARRARGNEGCPCPQRARSQPTEAVLAVPYVAAEIGVGEPPPSLTAGNLFLGRRRQEKVATPPVSSTADTDAC